MTFKELAEEELRRAIDSEDIISGIMAEAIEDKNILYGVHDMWCHNACDYPELIVALAMINVDRFILEWLKKNIPDHSAIPYYESLFPFPNMPQQEDSFPGRFI